MRQPKRGEGGDRLTGQDLDDNVDVPIVAVLAQVRGLLTSAWREEHTRTMLGEP